MGQHGVPVRVLHPSPLPNPSFSILLPRPCSSPSRFPARSILPYINVLSPRVRDRGKRIVSICTHIVEGGLTMMRGPGRQGPLLRTYPPTLSDSN